MTIRTVKFFLTTTLDEGWQRLEAEGVIPLYGEQCANGDVVLFAHLPENLAQEPLPFEWEEVSLPSVDWEEQWQTHAPGYDNGFLTIPISGYGDVRLRPGPGFGDLSHPSTRVVLEMMPGNVSGRPVVDIGCGSGILSLCASAMGSVEVYGIDISSEALLHAEENRRFNRMDNVHFSFPDELLFVPENPVILMNMIQSEQIAAWESLRQFHALKATLITSGILLEEKDKYLDQAASWNWMLKHSVENEGWLGFIFDL